MSKDSESPILVVVGERGVGKKNICEKLVEEKCTDENQCIYNSSNGLRLYRTNKKSLDLPKNIHRNVCGFLMTFSLQSSASFDFINEKILPAVHLQYFTGGTTRKYHPTIVLCAATPEKGEKEKLLNESKLTSMQKKMLFKMGADEFIIIPGDDVEKLKKFAIDFVKNPLLNEEGDTYSFLEEFVESPVKKGSDLDMVLKIITETKKKRIKRSESGDMKKSNLEDGEISDLESPDLSPVKKVPQKKLKRRPMLIKQDSFLSEGGSNRSLGDLGDLLNRKKVEEKNEGEKSKSPEKEIKEYVLSDDENESEGESEGESEDESEDLPKTPDAVVEDKKKEDEDLPVTPKAVGKKATEDEENEKVDGDDLPDTPEPVGKNAKDDKKKEVENDENDISDVSDEELEEEKKRKEKKKKDDELEISDDENDPERSPKKRKKFRNVIRKIKRRISLKKNEKMSTIKTKFANAVEGVKEIKQMEDVAAGWDELEDEIEEEGESEKKEGTPKKEVEKIKPVKEEPKKLPAVFSSITGSIRTAEDEEKEERHENLHIEPKIPESLEEVEKMTINFIQNDYFPQLDADASGFSQSNSVVYLLTRALSRSMNPGKGGLGNFYRLKGTNAGKIFKKTPKMLQFYVMPSKSDLKKMGKIKESLEKAMGTSNEEKRVSILEKIIGDKRKKVISRDDPERLFEGWDVHYYAFHNLLDDLRMVIEEFYRDASIQSNDGNTPLHYAVMKGNIEVIDYLLSLPGVDVNMYNHNRDTPFIIACRKRNLSIIRMFLRCSRVDKSLPDKRGVLPTDIYDEHTPNTSNRNLSVFESQKNREDDFLEFVADYDVENVEKMFLENDINFSAVRRLVDEATGEKRLITAMQIAIEQEDNMKMIRLLVEKIRVDIHTDTVDMVEVEHPRIPIIYWDYVMYRDREQKREKLMIDLLAKERKFLDSLAMIHECVVKDMISYYQHKFPRGFKPDSQESLTVVEFIERFLCTRFMLIRFFGILQKCFLKLKPKIKTGDVHSIGGNFRYECVDQYGVIEAIRKYLPVKQYMSFLIGKINLKYLLEAERRLTPLEMLLDEKAEFVPYPKKLIIDEALNLPRKRIREYSAFLTEIKGNLKDYDHLEMLRLKKIEEREKIKEENRKKREWFEKERIRLAEDSKEADKSRRKGVERRRDRHGNFALVKGGDGTKNSIKNIIERTRAEKRRKQLEIEERERQEIEEKRLEEEEKKEMLEELKHKVTKVEDEFERRIYDAVIKTQELVSKRLEDIEFTSNSLINQRQVENMEKILGEKFDFVGMGTKRKEKRRYIWHNLHLRCCDLLFPSYFAGEKNKKKQNSLLQKRERNSQGFTRKKYPEDKMKLRDIALFLFNDIVFIGDLKTMTLSFFFIFRSKFIFTLNERYFHLEVHKKQEVVLSIVVKYKDTRLLYKLLKEKLLGNAEVKEWYENRIFVISQLERRSDVQEFIQHDNNEFLEIKRLRLSLLETEIRRVNEEKAKLEAEYEKRREELSDVIDQQNKLIEEVELKNLSLLSQEHVAEGDVEMRHENMRKETYDQFLKLQQSLYDIVEENELDYV